MLDHVPHPGHDDEVTVLQGIVVAEEASGKRQEEEECEDCGREFYVTRIIDISYGTKPKEATEE